MLRAGTRLRITYRRSGERAATDIVVDPYGVAGKAGRWYLVADHDGDPRLFALTRLTSADSTTDPALHRAGATLDSVWATLRDRVERVGDIVFEIRLRRSRLDLAERILGARLEGAGEGVAAGTGEGRRAGARAGDGRGSGVGFGDGVGVGVADEGDDWVLASVRAAHPESVRQLLQFGDSIEILGPESARRRAAELARDLASRHAGPRGGDAPGGDAPGRTSATLVTGGDGGGEHGGGDHGRGQRGGEAVTGSA